MKSFRMLFAGLALTALAAISPSFAADTFKVDAVHSSVIYRVKHMNTSFSYGRFDQFEGAFTLDATDAAKSSFDLKIKVDSVNSANEKRDQHLKSPDFFNAKQFPSISFKSTKVVKSGEKYQVTGDLTLHGTTKPVTLDIVPTGSSKGPTGAAIAGVEATFKIKRSDFGMNKMVPMIGDEVVVIVSLEGGKS